MTGRVALLARLVNDRNCSGALIVATPVHELRWLGKLGPGRIVDGAHFFILTPNDDGSTRLTHGEKWSGVLITLMKPFVNKEEHKVGYESFNVAFKTRVERISTAAQLAR